MNTDHERIEKFLKGVVPPEHESDEHRRQLRGQIMSRLEAGRAGKGMSARWRTAALLAGLLCAGAAATELTIQVRHYFLVGRATDGTYYFKTERPAPQELTYTGADGKSRHATADNRITSSAMSSSNLDAAGLDQMRKDFEEMDALRQRKARELVGVTEEMVNGKPQTRAYTYKYVFSDGRTDTSSEGDDVDLSQAELEQQCGEIDKLRAEGKGDVRKAIDTEYDGQTQRKLLSYYVLSNGRLVSQEETDTNLPAPLKVLTTNQSDELQRLVSLKQGEFAGTAQAQVCGRTFNFKRHAYKLSDGTVVTHSEGDPEGGKSLLTDADWKELDHLLPGHGQPMGGYDEEVKGKMFHFTSKKYVLSDGTEVIWSHGKPQSDAGGPATRRGGVMVTGGLSTNGERK